MDDVSSKKRVLVVDGMPLTRFALVTIVECHPRMVVCAEARDAPEARQLCASHSPDVAVLDLDVPRGDGLDLLLDFRRLHPAVRLLVISEREDPLSIERAFRAGARSYISKREEGGELLAGLESLLTENLFASARVFHLVLEAMAGGGRRQRPRQDVAGLSHRELQVFMRMGRGSGATAISRELGVSVKTIETHQQRMKEKLHLCTASELHRCAARWMAQRGSRVEGSRGNARRGSTHRAAIPVGLGLTDRLPAV